MIRTDVITLEFLGDGQTKDFDVRIEGIPLSPEGENNFTVSMVDVDNVAHLWTYGVQYWYDPSFDPRGFSESMTIHLKDPLAVGEKIIVIRTTPILNLSQYPDLSIPPRQVEHDFDHVIKILQELGYRVAEVERGLAQEIQDRIDADTDLQEQLDNKVDKGEGVALHNWTHFRNGVDPITPNDIGALEQAPATGRPYMASTTRNGVTIWVEYYEALGEMSATTVCQHFHFTADDERTSWEIPHTLNTLSVTATVYDFVTGKRVYFPSFVKDEDNIILTSKIPLTGREFRGIIQGAGRINPEYFQGQIQIDVGAPSTVWHLVHHLHNRKPNIRIFNSDETQVVGFTVDWANATADEIDVIFANPKSGFAILDGWVNTEPSSFIPPTYTHIQNAPATVWHVNHFLNVTRPTIIVLDTTENVVVPQIDYANATLDSIDLIFYTPVMGTAIVKV